MTDPVELELSSRSLEGVDGFRGLEEVDVDRCSREGEGRRRGLEILLSTADC